MINKISWDQGFKRTYRKKVKNDAELKGRFWNSLETLVKDPFHPRLRTHKLTGRLEGLWAFSVGFDCRVGVECQDIVNEKMCQHIVNKVL